MHLQERKRENERKKEKEKTVLQGNILSEENTLKGLVCLSRQMRWAMHESASEWMHGNLTRQLYGCTKSLSLSFSLFRFEYTRVMKMAEERKQICYTCHCRPAEIL